MQKDPVEPEEGDKAAAPEGPAPERPPTPDSPASNATAAPFSEAVQVRTNIYSSQYY